MSTADVMSSPWPYGPAPEQARATRLRSPVLLVKPPMAAQAYGSTRARVMTNVMPLAGFAALAPPLLDLGAEVRILDLDLAEDAERSLARAVDELRPAVVGFTTQTASYPVTARLARAARERVAPWGGAVVLGGPHATALPEDPLEHDVVDAVVVGEGEEPFQRFVAGEAAADIAGMGLRDERDGAPRINERPEVVQDLDRLPLPAWQLYDLDAYSRQVNLIYMRRTPFANIETTRGCHYRCSFCQIGGTRVRAKSAARVVEEFQHAASFGFREVHIVDDLFNYKLARAKEVCQALIDAKVDLPWTLDNGIRVDALDEELAGLLKRAGCWQVAFGLEAGDDEVLKGIQKGTTTAKGRRAVEIAHRAGLETFGFFLLGLPGDTEQTVRKTIRFACDVPLDWASFRVPMPYPGTPLNALYQREGILRSTRWDSYVRHDPAEPLYEHPGVRWETLRELERKAYRAFYLRPGYALRRLVASLRAGTTLGYAKQFLAMRW